MSEPTGIKSVADLLAALKTFDFYALKYEMERLLAYRDECFRMLPFHVGDRVRLRADFAVDKTTQPGWWSSRECLVGGALATVKEIHFNTHSRLWYAHIVLDRETWLGHDDSVNLIADDRRAMYGFAFRWLEKVEEAQPCS